MVRIYLQKENKEDKEKYVDINIWSLLKANILSSLLLWAVMIGIIIGIGIIGKILGQ